MTKPTIDVNKPADGDIIGEGAERIRETRLEVYKIFPIGPDDLDWEETANWWPAGSLTGGQDPGIDNENPPMDDTFQDRAFLIGQTTLRYDYDIPVDHNAITPGPVDASAVTVDVPEGSTWTIVGDEDLAVHYLRDLNDVDVSNSENNDALIFDSATNSWYSHPAPRGPIGPQGPEGPQGTVGPEGPQGPQGNPGNTGGQGPQGPAGPEGPQGPEGPRGQRGPAGDTGPSGPEGPQGGQGNEGPEGPQGETGRPGAGIQFQGNVPTKTDLPGWPTSYGGDIGDAFMAEDTMHVWVWGDNAAWDDIGEIVGPEGPAGQPGGQGPEGPQGNPGTPGEKGDKGDDGDDGQRGQPGTPGAAATVNAGSTTTGNPGTNASVTNSGTVNAAVFDFTIPMGAKGEKGDDGRVGNEGPPGEQGPAATVNVGDTTTGFPGSDALVINSGSSSAAVLEFRIPQGERGEQGQKGDPGDPGDLSMYATKNYADNGDDTTLYMAKDYTDEEIAELAKLHGIGSPYNRSCAIQVIYDIGVNQIILEAGMYGIALTGMFNPGGSGVNKQNDLWVYRNDTAINPATSHVYAYTGGGGNGSRGTSNYLSLISYDWCDIGDTITGKVKQDNGNNATYTVGGVLMVWRMA